MRLRAGLVIVPLAVGAGCTISKSTPTERSSAGSVDTAAAAAESRAEKLVWSEVPAAPRWAPGIRIALVHGDPTVAGDYTIRLGFPSGYVIPPHWHPKAEQVTVLSGTFVLGMGETADRASASSYHSGDFLYMPGKMAHYGWTDGETVIQIHGTGPFKTYTVGEGAPVATRAP
jgi:hypothetical protein